MNQREEFIKSLYSVITRYIWYDQPALRHIDDELAAMGLAPIGANREFRVTYRGTITMNGTRQGRSTDEVRADLPSTNDIEYLVNSFRWSSINVSEAGFEVIDPDPPKKAPGHKDLSFAELRTAVKEAAIRLVNRKVICTRAFDVLYSEFGMDFSNMKAKIVKVPLKTVVSYTVYGTNDSEILDAAIDSAQHDNGTIVGDAEITDEIVFNDEPPF